MLSDIEIAQRAEMYPIGKVAADAPYKGLRPLRRFAAIPAPSLERYIRSASAPFQRG